AKASSSVVVSFSNATGSAGLFSATYDGTAHTASALVSGDGSGVTQTVTYGATCAARTDAGVCAATATYAGDANHDGSNGAATLTIAKASSSVAVVCTTGAPFTYTGSPLEPCTATASGAGGLNVAVTPVA